MANLKEAKIEAAKIKGAGEWNPDIEAATTVEELVKTVVAEADKIKYGEIKSTAATLKRAEKFIYKWDMILDKEYTAAREAAEKKAEEEKAGLSIVDEFLARWRKQAREYYIELRKKYIVERDAKHEVDAEGLRLIPANAWGGRKYNEEQIEEILAKFPTLDEWKQEKWVREVSYRKFNAWKARYTKSEIAIVESMYDEKFLDEILDREVEAKKKKLIATVEKKAGKIINARGLRIGVDGSINGLVEGEIKTVQVETIYAGGHNVQCLHYRTLVK